MTEKQFIFRDSDETHLIKYCGTDEMITIPEGITIIGKAAFASCYTLREVTFPSTLKVIENLAFYNCINLERTSTLSAEIANDAFVGCPKLKKENFVLKEMTIEQIESQPITDFYIKDYQRGYRWSKNEIEELLNDIKELIDNGNSSHSRYCLQPLIVKICTPGQLAKCIDKLGWEECKEKKVDTAYELIDGQQRLTTLLLILKECSARSDSISSVNYRIYYELLRKIDSEYIKKAEAIIESWLDEQNKKTEFNIDGFVSKIRENLFFIWYEMKTDNNIIVEEEFRNINDGQTPLTNAELFKALLLNPENAKVYDDGHQEDINAKLYEMAFQWDEMEQNLRNDNFWFFISNYECNERTHLDYLFELFAVSLESLTTTKRNKKREAFNNFKKDLESLDKTRDRYSFLAVKTYVDYLNKQNNNKRFETVKDVWKKIIEQYNHLYSWYSNPELYHTIGYLIAIEKTKHGNSIVPDIIIDLFKNYSNSDLSEIRNHVREEIANHLNDQIFENKKGNNITIFSQKYYERNKKDIRDFLLYINVWSTFKANEMFPFDRFKNTKEHKTGKTIKWDIEHVSARNLKEIISDEELEKIKPWWMREDKVSEEEDQSNRTWTKEEWKEFAVRVNESEPDNSISNLVLLDSNTNRSYGDALFFGKRNEIIERDKKSAYIPICTKNVFLKYYTNSPDFSVAWTEEDKSGYFAAILNCIKDSLLKETDTLNITIDNILETNSAEEGDK